MVWRWARSFAGYVALWYAAWRYWQSPNWRTVAWLAAATLLGVLAKLSLIILTGVAPFILLSRHWRHFPQYFALFTTTVYLGLCIAYQWNVRLVHPLEIVPKWADPIFTAVGQIFQWILVPAYFWQGCVGIYLLGTVRHTADPLYFLLARAGWSIYIYDLRATPVKPH